MNLFVLNCIVVVESKLVVLSWIDFCERLLLFSNVVLFARAEVGWETRATRVVPRRLELDDTIPHKVRLPLPHHFTTRVPLDILIVHTLICMA